MKFVITRKFILGKVEEKETVNLYTLLDSETLDKLVTIGGRFKDLEERELYEVELTVKMYSERFELKTGERKYLDVANTFLTGIKKVGTK